MRGGLMLAAAASSGVLVALAFPPHGLAWLAWFGLVPLLYSLAGVSWKRAFVHGAVAGLVCSVIFWSWFYTDFLPNFSTFPAYVNFLICCGLAIYLLSYYGVFAVAVNFAYRKSDLSAFIAPPLAFVTMEFLRGKVFEVFQWGMLGYTQYKTLPLIQIADITGVYGVTTVLVMANSAIALLLRRKFALRGGAVVALAATLVVVASAFIYGGARLSGGDSGGRTLRASLIQADISIADKVNRANDPKISQKIVDTFGRMTYEAHDAKPDIIIWPETALPFVFGLNQGPTHGMLEFQKRLGVPLLAGSIVHTEKIPYANSALMLEDGAVAGVQSKIKLVPFAEYVPGGLPIRKVIDNYNYKPGGGYTVFDLDGVKFGVLICYETVFPELSRDFVSRGARVLVAISNDAWFGDTSAPHQLFSMTVFRAVENRVPLIRAANTGISGFIDRAGRVETATDVFRRDIVTGEVAPGVSTTFYTAHGDVFVYACMFLFLLSVLLNFFNKDVVKTTHKI